MNSLYATIFKPGRAHLFAYIKWFQVLLSNTNNSISYS